MTYRKGYFKALLDVLHLIDMLNNQLIKSNQRYPLIRGIINDVLTNHKLDYFMECGGEINFNKSKLVNIEVGRLK